MLEAGFGSETDRRDNGAQPVVLDQAVAMASLDEPIDDVVVIKLTAGYKLVKSEAGAIQRVVPPSGTCLGEPSALAIERSGNQTLSSASFKTE